MKPQLLEHIVCPSCRCTFSIASQTLLKCSRGHRYPIRQGVPRLLDSLNLGNQQRTTRDSFKAKWNRIPNYGHDPKSRQFQAQWYIERYGWRTESRLARFLQSRTRILEAGTGTGPLMDFYTRHAGGEVFGLDISPAINSLYRHLGRRKNLHLVQADLRRAPFPPRYFDYIVSDQVLHHTPNTRASFRALVHHLKPGGQIAAYVYVKKGPIREFSDTFIRRTTTKMSPEECYRFCRALTCLARALASTRAEITLPERIPILNIPKGKHNVQRLVYWHMLKCFWNDDFDFETNVMINFDWYHPRNAFRHTAEEVKSWVAESKLKLVHFDVSLSGISFRAQRPLL